MAGNIQQLARSQACESAQHFTRPGTRWIEHHMGVGAVRPRTLAGHRATEIRRMKLDVTEHVESCIVPRSLEQRGLTFNSHYPPGAARQSKREVTDTAEQVEHHGVAIELEEIDGPRDERLVHESVDLHEIGGLELELQLESCQAITQGLERAGLLLERPY